MALYIEIKSADGMVSRTKLDPGKNRFTVRLGDNYRIVDDQTGLAPEGIAVKRIDNNLVVDGLDAQASTSVEFAEYYNICSAGSPCALTVDTGAGSQPVVITPGTQPIGALADGAFVLYDPNFAETAPAAPSMSDGTALRYGLYGLGGLAVVGIAAGGGGGGGDGGGGGGGTRPDGSLKMTSSEFVNSRTPTITGEGEPGSRVILRIDTDGDGAPNVTYATTVGADFKWSVNLASAIPESGALPAGGLPDQSNVGITSATSAGNASLPTFVLTFDGVAPGPAVIGVVAADDQISVSEKADGVIVAGTAEANSSIIVTWGTQSLSTIADAQGSWQVPFAAASIGNDGPASITAVVTDRAGNVGEAAARPVAVNTTPVINPVTGDGVISLGEWAAGFVVSGTNPAGTRAGVDVTVTVGSTNKVVQTDAAGNWSAAYSAADLPVAGNAPVTAVASVGAVTGSAASASFSINTLPAINPVGGADGVISLSERAAGIVVSGGTPAGTGPGVAMAVSLGSASKAAQTDANGNWSATFSAAEIPNAGAITASAAALAGGTSGQTATASATVNTAPTVAGSVTADNVVNAAELGTAAISGTAPVDALNGTQVIVTLTPAGGAALAPQVATVTNGTWSMSLAGAGVPAADADYSVSAVGRIGAVDGAAATGAFKVDVTPPPIGNVVVANDPYGPTAEISIAERLGGFNVHGATEAGASIVVTLGGVSKPVTVAATGEWTTTQFTILDPLTPNPDGSYRLVISGTDQAGNPKSPIIADIPVQAPPPVAIADASAAHAATDQSLLLQAGDLLGNHGAVASAGSTAAYVSPTATTSLLQALEDPASGHLS